MHFWIFFLIILDITKYVFCRVIRQIAYTPKLLAESIKMSLRTWMHFIEWTFLDSTTDKILYINYYLNFGVMHPDLKTSSNHCSYGELIYLWRENKAQSYEMGMWCHDLSIYDNASLLWQNKIIEQLTVIKKFRVVKARKLCNLYTILV